VAKTRRNARTGQRETYSDSEPYVIWDAVASERHGEYQERVHASEAVALPEMEALGPWRTLELEDLGETSSEQWTTETPSLSQNEATQRARERVKDLERQVCAQLVERLDNVSTRFRKVHSWRRLLPVWVFQYRYGGKSRRVVMNAHSGQVCGRRPICWLKVGIAVGLAVLVVLAVVGGLWLFGGH
jgi:hypothetical protein